MSDDTPHRRPGWTPEEIAYYDEFRRLTREGQQQSLLWANFWLQALRDFGIPIVGKFKEMTPADYTAPDDAYVFMFAHLACEQGCQQHDDNTAHQYRGTIFVYIGEYADRLVSIRRLPKPKAYNITENIGLNSQVITKGTTVWEENPAPLRPEDVQAKVFKAIKEFGCKHLKKVLTITEAELETYFQLNLLALQR